MAMETLRPQPEGRAPQGRAHLSRFDSHAADEDASQGTEPLKAGDVVNFHGDITLGYEYMYIYIYIYALISIYVYILIYRYIDI